MPSPLVTYTVLLGGYESLNEQEVLAGTDRGPGRFVCLTDDPALRSNFWEVVQVEPAFAADPVRSQRLLKILGHESLGQPASSLYVDNSVGLLVTPEELVDRFVGGSGADVALPLHSYRATVLDEFGAVLDAHSDDATRIDEQLRHYEAVHREVLSRQPFWTAILVRRHNAGVAAAMRTWADHVLRYSRRDQLSARVALDRDGLQVRGVEIDNFSSSLHRWPLELERRIDQGKVYERPTAPMLADLRAAQSNVDTLTSELAFTRELQQSTTEELTRTQARAVATERELDDVKRYLDELNRSLRAEIAQRDAHVAAMQRSRLWRLRERLVALRRRDGR